MSKKGQKVLASAAILSLVMSTVAMAAPTAGTAISGSSRVDTAIAIAKQAYSKWTGSKVAVIANGADAHLVDALTVAPLAAQKQAPIFLTLGTTTLEDSVISALKAQGVTTVYVVGGTVTTDVDAQLKAAGVTAVTHLAGATRFETAKAINTELEKAGAPSAYAVVNTNASVADALSIAAEAAKQNIEIVLAADANSVPVDLTGKKVYAVGGTGVLSDALVTKLNATRLAGANRFATNAAVLQGLDASLDYTTTYVADGTDAHLVDSLPGSVLAAQTGSPIVLVSDSVAPEVTSVLTGKVDKMTTVTPLGGAVSSTAVAGVVNPTSTTPTQGATAVSSVSATAANSIKVVFNGTISDTSKVVFSVARATTPVTVTATWNDAKTEATLTSSANLPEGDYTVGVKNDTTDLGSNKITITAQKVAKIAVTSNILGVTAGTGNTPGKGYIGYAVYDQYGNDITNTSLANPGNFNWTCGIGNVDAKDGIMTISSFNTTPLTQYQSTVITIVNRDSAASTSATVTVSQSQGTISDITLNKLVNADGKDIVAGDVTDKFYIDFTAKDLAGNVTTNYQLIKAGLLYSDSSAAVPSLLYTSNGTLLNAKLIQDPNDNTKALIEVDPTSDTTLRQDQQVVITALTQTGKSSYLTLTVKKPASVETFSLMAPSEDVATGETKTIPFVAYDQTGAALTKYSDLVNKVNFYPAYSVSTGTGLELIQNADGTAALKYHAPAGLTDNTPEFLTATVADTGKTSNLNLTVEKPVYVYDFQLDSSVIVPLMQWGANQKLDFGWNDGGFKFVDQYGRTIDMTSGNTVGTTSYKVVARVTSGTSIVIDTNAKEAYQGNEINIKTATSATGTAIPGTSTVEFDVLAKTASGNYPTWSVANNRWEDAGNPVAPAFSKTTNITVVKDGDITGYTLSAPSAALYATFNAAHQADPANAITAFEKEYYQKLKVYGQTSGGGKVLIDATEITGKYVDNSDFYVTTPAVDGATKNVYVYAATLPSTKTASSGIVSVTVLNRGDNRLYTAKQSVTSKTDTLAAQSVDYYAYLCGLTNGHQATGMTTDGNTITVALNGKTDDYTLTSNLTTLATNAGVTLDQNSILAGLDGKTLVEYATDGSSTSQGYIYLYANDQYGKTGMPLADVRLIDSLDASGTHEASPLVTISTDANHTLTFNRLPVSGESIIISGTTVNGLVETIKVVFK